jgi:hypothetical protein
VVKKKKIVRTIWSPSKWTFVYDQAASAIAMNIASAPENTLIPLDLPAARKSEIIVPKKSKTKSRRPDVLCLFIS